MNNIDEKYYIISGKYRWKVTDQNGTVVNLVKYKIDSLIGDNYIIKNVDGQEIELQYSVLLTSIKHDELKQIISIYRPDLNRLITYSLADSDNIRITLYCNSLERAEELVDLICDGENLQPYPINDAFS